MSLDLFDNPEDLPALATYAGLLLTIPELAPAVVHGSNSIPAMMRALGGITDPATLEAMAGDPNCSVEALTFLAGSFPATFCANPVFPLLLLENPSLPATMDPVSLGRLLAYPGVPADFVAAVAAYGRPELALAARLHVALAEPVVDWSSAVSQVLARLPRTPADDLLVVLAALDLVPDWLREHLAADERVARALAGQEVEPETAPAATATPTGRAAIAADPSTPVEQLWAFAEDDDAAVRAALALNPALEPGHLAELKRLEDWADNDPAVYKALASNPHTPPEVLCALAADQKALFTNVRRAVSRNPSTPPAALELLADELYAADIRLYLAKHANLGPAQREKMKVSSLDAALGAGDDLYRAIALCHPQAHPRALALADRSPHWLERLALARNPSTSPATLARLREDGNSIVRAAAADMLHGGGT